MLPSQNNRHSAATGVGEGENAGMRTRGATRRAAAAAANAVASNKDTKMCSCADAAGPDCCSSASSLSTAHAYPAPGPAAPRHEPQHHQSSEVASRYEAELAQRRAELGPSHPSVAETLNALGLVHQHMRSDPQSALRCHAEALRILRRAADAERAAMGGVSSIDGGGGSPQSELRFDLAVTLSDMGDAYWKIGCPADASAAYGSALEAFEDAGKGGDHPRVVSTRRRLNRLERGFPMPGGLGQGNNNGSTSSASLS